MATSIGPEGELIRVIPLKPVLPELPSIIAHTGFGSWQTVSVETIDEEAEALIREEEEMRQRDEERLERISGPGKYREVKVERHVQEEDVLSTFDPYGTNIYKGMKVGDDHLQTELETMSKAGVKVGFKKRKKMSAISSSSVKEEEVKIKVEKDDREPASLSSGSSETQNCDSQIHIKSEIKEEVRVKIEPPLSADEQARVDQIVEERKRMAEKISFNFGGRRSRQTFDEKA